MNKPVTLVAVVEELAQATAAAFQDLRGDVRTLTDIVSALSIRLEAAEKALAEQVDPVISPEEDDDDTGSCLFMLFFIVAVFVAIVAAVLYMGPA